jgi:8-oxo-dGTP pyrophosphatase MutT (NUDIX family)
MSDLQLEAWMINREELPYRLHSRLEHHLCDLPPEQDDGYYPASVLILFTWNEDRWNILYTQRTEKVRDHKGQVSFPGGAWEEEDLCLKDTALRETLEEIGIPSSEISILGSLPPRQTVTGYYIVPYIGLLDWPQETHLQENEVESLFLVPVDWLADETKREEREFTTPGSVSTRKALFYKEYAGHTLWGITANLTVQILDLLK